MSLLGKLFSNLPTAANNSTSRPQTALDSNLEDHFTYNLLFPDAEALCHHDQVFSLSQSTVLTNSATNAFDYNPEFDLDQRDVRVIIMQEATPASGSAYLLYDSMAPPPSASLSTLPPWTGSRQLMRQRLPPVSRGAPSVPLGNRASARIPDPWSSSSSNNRTVLPLVGSQGPLTGARRT